jgi:hypothetical protein
MTTENEIIQKGTKLLKKGASVFEIETYLKEHNIPSSEHPIFLNEMLDNIQFLERNREQLLKRLKLIVSSVILIALSVLFLFGYLGIIGIGLVGAIIIFWILQTLGILGVQKTNSNKFNRHK